MQWRAACAAGRRWLLPVCGGCHRWPVDIDTLVCTGIYWPVLGTTVGHCPPSSTGGLRQDTVADSGGHRVPVEISYKFADCGTEAVEM